VLSVIGGWFITAGAAFILCFLITNALYFGSFVAMIIAVAIAITLLVRSNRKNKGDNVVDEDSMLLKQLNRTENMDERWELLKMLVQHSTATQLQFVSGCYQKVTTAFLKEDYSPLRQAVHEIETARKQLKRQRKQHILLLRKIEPVVALEKNTWFFLANNSVEQMLFCLKRINDPCCEHVGNNFRPVSREFANNFMSFQKQLLALFQQTDELFQSAGFSEGNTKSIRENAEQLQHELAEYRKQVIDAMQKKSVNIESTIVYLNLIQESEQIISGLRHMLRGMTKFCAFKQTANPDAKLLQFN